MGSHMSNEAMPAKTVESPPGLDAPLRFLPGNISIEELNLFRMQYQAFRTGKAAGAKGEIHDSYVTHLAASSACEPEKPVTGVTVLGAGAYGTAMATVIARNGHQVKLYARDEEQVRTVNETRRNPKYLCEFDLPAGIRATSSLQDALEDAELVYLALPAQKVPQFLKDNKDLIKPTTILVNTAKGLYLETRQLLSDAVYEALDRERQPLVLLSGPSFAKEIMEGHPTTVVCASQKLYHAVRIQKLMSSAKFKVFTSQDVIGVELGGALKNPLAVGAGIIEGLGFGINTMTAYITRATNELTSLIVAMGGQPQTASGLSGVGDLMLTAFGSLSRNRTCGMRLAKGETLKQICNDTTVEGVPTAQVAVYFADQCGLDVPIFRTVEKMIAGKLKPERAAEELMTLPLTTEFPGLNPSLPRGLDSGNCSRSGSRGSDLHSLGDVGR